MQYNKQSTYLNNVVFWIKHLNPIIYTLFYYLEILFKSCLKQNSILIMRPQKYIKKCLFKLDYKYKIWILLQLNYYVLVTFFLHLASLIIICNQI